MTELVIKIPDTAYEGILNADKAGGNWGSDLLGVLCEGIANGTPLPKGHGRLIDADEIIAEATKGMKYPTNYKYMECVIANMKIADTILEADKGSEKC